MKKYFLQGLLLLGTFIATAQDGYEVRLKLKNTDSAKLLISYSTGNNYVMDTNATFSKGVYIFKGKVAEPTMASVVVRKKSLSIQTGKYIIPSPSLEIILSNDKIEITGDANEIFAAKVKGGRSNNEWNSIKAAEGKLTKEGWDAMKQAYQQLAVSNDSMVLKAAYATRNEAGKVGEKLRDKFIEENPNSLVSIYFLSRKLVELSAQELEEKYNKLGPDYKSSGIAKRIEEQVKTLKATAIGQAAIELNKKDMQGNPVNLNTLKGKYVVLDFWGSWCGPCRKGHPHLKALYSKYKSKGLEIVGIAAEGGPIEQARSKWKKAVEEDGIGWIQVLNDEDKEQFDAVKSYGISAFPTKVLLDTNGKIIARYIGDVEDFDKKLKEIFGE